MFGTKRQIERGRELCLGAAAALGVLGAAGCAAPMATITEMEVVVASAEGALENSALVVPGSTAELQATVAGVTGRGDVVRREVVRWRDYSVDVKGADYDESTRTIRFSTDDAVADGGYEVSVAHVSSGYRVVKRYQADFARIYGPDPEDIARFHIDLMQGDYAVPVGSALIPGAAYRLRATVTDQIGQDIPDGKRRLPDPALLAYGHRRRGSAAAE